MFKLKWKTEDAERIRHLLNVEDSEDYQYILTDDPNQLEEGKIGIVFSEDDIDEINTILDVVARNKQIVYTFETSDGWVRIKLDDITYIESFGTDIYVHLSKVGKVVKVKEQLYKLEAKLARYHFVRTGKSFIVNITKIQSIETSLNSKLELRLENNEVVEVARSYIKSFKQTLGIGKGS